MQLLFSFDRGMKVEKTLMQTLASQLSSTLMQLLFSFDRGMRVEKTLMQTLASQLSSTLIQLLFSSDRGMRVEKTLMQTLASQLLSCNSCSRLTGVRELRKHLCKLTLASRLSSSFNQGLYLLKILWLWGEGVCTTDMSYK